jgi:quercetin dioxygenase-like cupin family protein
MTRRTIVRVAMAAVIAVMSANNAAQAQRPVPLDTGLAPWVSNPAAPGRANQKLVGDRTKPGVFIERVKFPKGSSAPPHVHTIDGYVTILKGEFTVGFGTKVDSCQVIRVKAGGFIVLPANVPHYEWFDEDTIEHVVGVGPMTTSLVDTLGRPIVAPARREK